LNFSALPRARPPTDDDLGGRQFGAVALGDLVALKRLLPLSATAPAVSTAALPPVAAAGRSPVVRTVMTLVASVALHRGDGVAGVDRALEGVGGQTPW
jgi:hypothetical protein